MSLPMIAQSNSEWDAREKTDYMGNVSDLRVIAGYPALFVNHDDVVDEVDDRNQSLRREEKPRELERANQHYATRKSEDCGRGA